MADGGRAGTGIEIERAARIIAEAWGYGSAWGAADYYIGEAQAWQRDAKHGDDMPAATPGLSICRQTETLERVHHLVNREWLKSQSPASQSEALAWERENKNKPARGITEHEHWQRASSVAAYPRAQSSRAPAVALAYAGLDGPLCDLLLLYALEDWALWPEVKRYAVACLPGADWDAAVSELMQGRAPSRASRLLWRWLDRAARAFLMARQAVAVAERDSGLDLDMATAGTHGNGMMTETWWRPS